MAVCPRLLQGCVATVQATPSCEAARAGSPFVTRRSSWRDSCTMRQRMSRSKPHAVATALAVLAASCGGPSAPSAPCPVQPGADGWVLVGRQTGPVEAVYARSLDSQLAFRFETRPDFGWSF